jgi:hypothetical protein
MCIQITLLNIKKCIKTKQGIQNLSIGLMLKTVKMRLGFLYDVICMHDFNDDCLILLFVVLFICFVCFFVGMV